MLNELDACISRGIDFLYKNQLPHGEFPSYRIYTREGAGNWDLDSAIFPTALIAHSLRFLRGQKVHEMRNKAKAFLLQEMEPPGVWRYWSAQSGVTIMPDLDDTCCASAVLLEDRPEIYMDNVSTIHNNRDENGLFYTFLKPEEDEENDIDSVVNANVLFYIKEFEGVDKVVDYLHAVISENREESSSETGSKSREETREDAVWSAGSDRAEQGQEELKPLNPATVPQGSYSTPVVYKCAHCNSVIGVEDLNLLEAALNKAPILLRCTKCQEGMFLVPKSKLHVNRKALNRKMRRAQQMINVPKL